MLPGWSQWLLLIGSPSVGLFQGPLLLSWIDFNFLGSFEIHWVRKYLVSIYTPRFNKVERGVYWYHLVRLSVCLSVRLSVCGQNCVRSVSSTILIGSISYLHILSSNFRRCVVCNAHFKIQTTLEGMLRVKFVSRLKNLIFWQIL